LWRIIIFFYQFKVAQISLPTILQQFNQCFVFCQLCDCNQSGNCTQED
jgi:hypothetical protein